MSTCAHASTHANAHTDATTWAWLLIIASHIADAYSDATPAVEAHLLTESNTSTQSA